MVVYNATLKASRPLLSDQREKKVEILSRTQREIPKEFVVSALNATNYDVVAGFDLLELLFGDISGDDFLCSVVKSLIL